MRQPGFHHEALLYRDEDDFLGGAVPFLRAALEAGEPALVAVSEAKTELLAGELGADAERIEFADMEDLGRNPARIIPFWRDFLTRNDGGSVSGIGEPVWPGRGATEIDECERHESLLNIAFSATTSWSLLCPYDRSALDDGVLENVAHSHRHVIRDGVEEESADYVEEEHPFEGTLDGYPPGTDPFFFDRLRLAELRGRVSEVAQAAGMSSRNADDLVLSASELATNSVVHGGGSGTMRVWRTNDSLLVDVEDDGLIEKPLVGRLRPEPTQLGGRGLWLANQLCDLVQIRSGARGTTVRLRMQIA